MDLPGPVILFVDRADFHREQKAHLSPASGRQLRFHWRGDLRLEAKQALFGRLQFFLQLSEPLRMGEVRCSNDVDALQRRPFEQILGIQLLAGRPRVTRVQVHVGDEAHGRASCRGGGLYWYCGGGRIPVRANNCTASHSWGQGCPLVPLRRFPIFAGVRPRPGRRPCDGPVSHDVNRPRFFERP